MTISAAAFRIWLAEAALGDELVYHIGDLSADSDPSRSSARALALNALLDEVLSAKRHGRVSLRQEPLPARGASQHIARRVA
jgi:hypothetical protein